MKTCTERRTSILSWWESQRLLFNGRIVLGFAICWLGMAGAAIASGADWDRNVFFATSGVLEALRLLAVVAVASNVVYFLGPAAERFFSRDGATVLRRVLFALLWGVPVIVMLTFAVCWGSYVLESPSLLDGGQPE